jgi:hypothetical protein
MSESNINPRAQLNSTLPPLLPVGYRVGANIQLQVMPMVHVMLVPPHKMRTTVEGVVEVLAGDPEEWLAPPEGAEVFELGKPLPPEKCDVVAILGTMVEDMMGPKLIGSGGQAPRGRMSSGPMAVLARAPLVDWQASHVGTLRGPVE